MIAKLIGRIVKRPAVYTRLHEIAMRDPAEHIMSPDGQDVYMFRYWLFNRITDHKRKYPFIPFSIRVHHIVQPDHDRHMHDHPFNARTWIMVGNYVEERREELDYSTRQARRATKWRLGDHYDTDEGFISVTYYRLPGDTSTLGFEQYHRITSVDPRYGALTLFMFGRYKGDWGFLVNGVKMTRAWYYKRFKGIRDK